MPQFDFANFMPQLAWLALCFVILYFGIVRATLPRIARLVDERENKVAGDISAAELAKTESDTVHRAYEAEMAQAHVAAHRAIAEAKTQSTRTTEGRLAEAARAIEQQALRSAASLESARAAAVVEIERVAADAAAEIVEKLSGRRPDETEARAAVLGAMA
jgi:F-type H+-transporting ATPase subunit b